jgi:pimeloyl-ACP methyl ester carboxylesterase
MGGTIALQLALDHSESVEKLVLVNTFAKLNFSDVRVWPYYLLRLVLLHWLGLPYQAKVVARRIFPEENQATYRNELVSQIMQSDPAGYRAAMRALTRFDVSSRLGEIKQPTLVVSGERDTTVPILCQREMAGGISEVRLLTMRNSGHASTIDQHEEFNRILLDFLLT